MFKNNFIWTEIIMNLGPIKIPFETYFREKKKKNYWLLITQIVWLLGNEK